MKRYILVGLILVICICIYISIDFNMENFEDGRTMNLNAIIPHPRPENPGEIIVFNDNKWIVYDVPNSRITKGVYNVFTHSMFKNIPSKFIPMDAAIPRPSDHEKELIIFKDTQWLLWNYLADKIEGGPYNITDHKWFKSLPAEFNFNIDAACLCPDDPKKYIIFFKENRWLLWNFRDDKIQSGPYTFGGGTNLRTLPKEFLNGINAAYMNPTNKNELCLFSGVFYLVWNWKQNKISENVVDMRKDPTFRRLASKFTTLPEDDRKKYITMDKSGNNHHAAMYNIDYVANIPKISDNFDKNQYEMYKTGKSIKLNGRNSYLEIQDVKNLYKTGFSVSLFFKLTEYVSSPARNYVLLNCYRSGGLDWQLLVNNLGLLEFKIKRSSSNSWSSVFSKSKITNIWYHVTIGQGNISQHMYLNEDHISKTNIIRIFPLGIDNIYIGAGGMFPGLTNHFEGLIGEVRAYNRVLTHEEVCKFNPMCPIEQPKVDDVIIEPIVPKETKICSFTPKGFKEIDCYRNCRNNKEMNQCEENECLTLCAQCKNADDCIWLEPPELYKPEQLPDPVDNTKCNFKPYGLNINHCTDVCSGKNKDNWGGYKCNRQECGKICRSCDDEYCKWIDTGTETVTDVKNIPNKIRLEVIPDDKSLVLSWKKPQSEGSSITKYHIIHYETRSRDKNFNVSTINKEDINCKNTDKCLQTLTGLTNNTYYSVGITAENDTGISDLSNILVIAPKNNIPESASTANDPGGGGGEEGGGGTLSEYQKKSIAEVLQQSMSGNKGSFSLEDLDNLRNIVNADSATEPISTPNQNWMSQLVGKTLDFNVNL